MKVHTIEKFLFNKAEYIISSGDNSLILSVDYKNNKFSLSPVTAINKELEKEVISIAKDLLSRKHAVNFAER